MNDNGTSGQVQLDEIDKAIIRELQLDGRMSYAQLGPEVGLSQAAVRQRVQRLTDSKVIEVVAITDPAALISLTVWKYCLISRSLRLPKIFLSRPEIIALE